MAKDKPEVEQPTPTANHYSFEIDLIIYDYDGLTALQTERWI